MIILAIDALEYEKVIEFGCDNLKQEFFGKTDITEFSEPRTMVLWSSFITGENKEKEVLGEGNQEMWNKRFPVNETVFSKFDDPCVIDLPGFSYNLEAHEESRKLLKDFFMTEDKDKKEEIKKAYNEDAFSHHRAVKEEFMKALESNHDFILGYFSVIDVIGHLNFGNNIMMKMLYKEMDEIAGMLRSKGGDLIILSDHGMKALGMFGDHSEYGFWSTNFEDLEEPKITEFRKVIESR